MSFVSLSGVYSPAKKIEDSKVPIALEKYLGSNPSVRKIRIHFDNDIAGRKAAQTLKIILPDKYEIVDEPPKAGKDFNDFLCMQMGIYNILRLATTNSWSGGQHYGHETTGNFCDCL